MAAPQQAASHWPQGDSAEKLPGDKFPAEKLIGGSFAVDFALLLPGAGGGLPAFAAVDRQGGRTGVMAIQVRPSAPPRAQALTQLMARPTEGVLGPLAHGPAAHNGAGAAWFVLCQAPPGPPLWTAATANRPWSENDLLDYVLRPVAHALEQLHERQLTHRAIRPDNLFRAGPREPVVLGAAWAAPPGSLQPPQFEPPYMAMSLPGGRGDGSIADDVYALGVTLLTLALGRLPLAGLDEPAITKRKLELGSYTALVGEDRLPPAISDLVRGMLAEDPEHRPPPALLADPAAARARRVAARPPRRAQRQLDIAGQGIWTGRTLAHAIATDTGGEAVALLRSGSVDRWIRRNLGDSLLAARLEDAVRLRSTEGQDERADAMLAMRAVALLDPLAPLCWRGLALWPDGLGPALAATAEGDPAQDRLQQIVATEAIAIWAAARPERCDVGLLRMESYQHRTLMGQRGWAGGLARLRYALNPLLACRSPQLEGQAATRLPDLLPALEAASTRTERRRHLPIDREVAAFLAARHEYRVETELAALSDTGRPDAVALAQLRLLSGLQSRQSGLAVPHLAAWLADHLTSALAVWHNRARRTQMEQALKTLTGAGQLTAMLAALDDPDARAQDEEELQSALAVVREIDAQLEVIQAGSPMRAETARRIAQEVLAGVGALACTIAFVAAVLW